MRLRPHVVHGTHLTVAMIARAFGGGGGCGHIRTQRGRHAHEQGDLEHEPDGGDTREPRSYPTHEKASLAHGTRGAASMRINSASP